MTRRFPLTKVHPDGLFESVLRGVEQPFDYVLEMKSHAGETWREKDAYSFGPVLGEMDIYLFNEGTHYEIYKKLGAHMMELGGVAGTALFRLGAQCPARVRGGGLQPLGRPRPCDAQNDSVGHLGNFRSACAGGRPL